jgi:hypothetical protein
MGDFDISNKADKCFICGITTNLVIKNSDIYFCNSNKCIKKVNAYADRLSKGPE